MSFYSNPAEQVELAMDKLAVTFGLQILKIIPGRVSTEVDARWKNLYLHISLNSQYITEAASAVEEILLSFEF